MIMDIVIAGGLYSRVIAINDYKAGEHKSSPIRNDMPAREWVTVNGSRWSGVKPDGSVFVNPLR